MSETRESVAAAIRSALLAGEPKAKVFAAREVAPALATPLVQPAAEAVVQARSVVAGAPAAPKPARPKAAPRPEA